MTTCLMPLAPAVMKNSSNHLVRDAAYADIDRIRSTMYDGGRCQPRSAAASRNSCAYGSMNSGQSPAVSSARAIATPSAVWPTPSVMSQLSSSVLAIATAFPIFGELMQFVLGQQIIANVLLAVRELPDAVGHHRRGDQREQAGEDHHADVGVTAQPDRRSRQHQQQAEHLRLGRRVHPRQGIGKADHADRGGQRECRAAQHQHSGDDVQCAHRGLRTASRLSTSGTRKRATLTEPTKLINASAVRPYVTVVSRLNAAHVPIAHIVTATSVSTATSRSRVLGPASRRNMVMNAAAVSMTAAMIHTTVMRDPPSLLAGKSCAIRLRSSLGSHALSLSANVRQRSLRSNDATNSRSICSIWR